MQEIIFHSFSMGDVDDVEIYAAQPIYNWQQTEHGQWVMANAKNLVYHTDPDHNSLGYRIRIQGEIEEIKATEYFLRW